MRGLSPRALPLSYPAVFEAKKGTKLAGIGREQGAQREDQRPSSDAQSGGRDLNPRSLERSAPQALCQTELLPESRDRSRGRAAGAREAELAPRGAGTLCCWRSTKRMVERARRRSGCTRLMAWGTYARPPSSRVRAPAGPTNVTPVFSRHAPRAPKRPRSQHDRRASAGGTFSVGVYVPLLEGVARSPVLVLRRRRRRGVALDRGGLALDVARVARDLLGIDAELHLHSNLLVVRCAASATVRGFKITSRRFSNVRAVNHKFKKPSRPTIRRPFFKELPPRNDTPAFALPSP